MATTITQVDGSTAINGTADDDIIVAQHLTGVGVPNPQILSGGAGDDVIFGDHQQLFFDSELAGGNSNIIAPTSIDNILFWGQRENPDVLNSTTVPYTTVLATGDGNQDFFSVTVGDGETITVDIDRGFATSGNGSLDTLVDMFNSSGVFVTGNDDGGNANGAFGSGPGLNRDSFFTFTNTTGSTQVYTLRVQDFNSGAIPIGATYMMNVSVTNHVMSNAAVFGADQIDGGAGNDTLYGGEGDDIINGGTGDDLIEGGSGADTIDGGAGNDTISFITSAAGIFADINAGVGSTSGSGDSLGDTYANIENIIGSAHNDFFGANASANVIDGREGFDIIGYFFNDDGVDVDLAAGTITGGNNATGDTLLNIEGVAGSNLHNDTLRGDAGANELTGNGGDDVLAGRGGADALNGGDGRDTVDYSESASAVQVNLLAGTATGGDAAGDTLNDIENIIGSNFGDTLTGDAGDNTLDGRSGDDVLDGGDGNDILNANFGTDVFIGGAGIDTLQIAGTTVDSPTIIFNIDLEAGTDTFGNTYTGIENVNGSAGNDAIIGDAESNVIDGGDGNDTLSDGGGFDTLRGGAGDDTFIVRVGSADLGNFNEIYDGGADTDTLIWNGAYSLPVVWDMTSGTFEFVGVSFRTIANFENFDASGMPGFGTDTFDIVATSGVNVITGGNDDIIEGGAGADILDGGAGIDTLSYASSNERVYLYLYSGTALFGHAAGDTHTNFENVTGSAFNDFLIGDSGDNIIRGGEGNDNLRDFFGGADQLFGEGGADRLLLDSLSSVGAGDVFDGGSGFDSLIVESSGTYNLRDSVVVDIENIVFDRFGSDLAPAIVQLTADQIDSGIVSAQKLDQAAVLEVFMSTASTADLSGFDISQFDTSSGDRFAIFGDSDSETITGTDYDDEINGGGGGDIIEGGAGADTLDGGAGVDTLSYASSNAGVSVFLFSGTAQRGHASGDTHTNFENIIGSDFGDGLAGDNGDNILRGGAGNDTLFHGGTGADQFFGEDGDDTIDLDRSNDMSAGDVYDGGAGFDTLETSNLGFGAYDLRGASLVNIERLAVVGDVAFPGFPDSASDVLVTLNVLQAISSGLTEVQFVPDDLPDLAVNFVMDAATSVDLSGLTVTGAGSVGRLILSGDADSETMRGSAIRDDISGNAGNDTIEGRAGGDTLDGGAGIDTLSYASSDAGVVVNLEINFATGGHATGDTIMNFENLTGSAFGDDLIGTSGDNLLFGEDGDDTLRGLAGRDEYYGRDGNDNLRVGNAASDVVPGEIFDGGAGFDKLTLGSFGTGSEREYDLRGSTFSSLEQLVFNTDPGASSGDISAKIDVVQMSEAGLSSFAVENRDGSSTFNVEIFMGADASLDLSGFTFEGGFGSLAGDRVTVFGDGTSETITGTTGRDDIFGGGGNDIIEGGAGGDLLDGGAGIDTLSFANSAGSVSASLRDNAGFAGDASGDTYANFENLIGSDFDDVFEGNNAANAFDGGLGRDTVSYLGDDAALFVSLAAGLVISGGAQATSDTFVGIENITGTDGFADDITGDDADNMLSGGGGDDALDGREGADVLDGGAGSDTVRYSSSDAAVVVDLQSGFGSGGHATGDILIDIENLFGSAFGDTLIGNTADNFLQGQAGDDTIIISRGSNQVFGGLGDDTIVDDGLADPLKSDFLSGGDGFDTLVLTAVQWGADMRVDLLSQVQTISGGTRIVDTITEFERVIVAGRAEVRGDNFDNVIEAVGGFSGEDPASVSNILSGEGGNDRILAGLGDDVVSGGSGDDELFGEGGDDLLMGDAGDDLLDGGAGIDTVSYAAASGAVAVFLNRADDVGGGQGADTFVSIENVIGSDFDDRINGNAADNHLMGGLGNDQLFGLAGNDLLEGGAGDDELNGAGGDDTLLGGDGNDMLFGLGGADLLDGGAGDDLIEGGVGVDTIEGGEGADIIAGFFGIDTINGGAGDDDIRADGSGDTVDGGAGNDRIVGGNGQDILWGGAGNDVLFGGSVGAGGGAGLRDVFVFKSFANGGGGFDIIRDFEDTIDKIDLSESGYTRFADVLADATQTGTDVRINFDFGGIVRIDNFDLADLTAGDFLF